MALGPERLARASALKPWRTVGIWVGMLLLAGFLSSHWEPFEETRGAPDLEAPAEEIQARNV